MTAERIRPYDPLLVINPAFLLLLACAQRLAEVEESEDVESEAEEIKEEEAGQTTTNNLAAGAVGGAVFKNVCSATQTLTAGQVGIISAAAGGAAGGALASVVSGQNVFEGAIIGAATGAAMAAAMYGAGKLFKPQVQSVSDTGEPITPELLEQAREALKAWDPIDTIEAAKIKEILLKLEKSLMDGITPGVDQGREITFAVVDKDGNVTIRWGELGGTHGADPPSDLVMSTLEMNPETGLYYRAMPDGAKVLFWGHLEATPLGSPINATAVSRTMIGGGPRGVPGPSGTDLRILAGLHGGRAYGLAVPQVIIEPISAQSMSFKFYYMTRQTIQTSPGFTE